MSGLMSSVDTSRLQQRHVPGSNRTEAQQYKPCHQNPTRLRPRPEWVLPEAEQRIRYETGGGLLAEVNAGVRA